MKTQIYTPITKQEYWELYWLGAKLPKTKNIPEHQIASIHAYRLYRNVYVQQDDGWNFWYTNQQNTFEAFRTVHPLHFRFSHSNYWKKIELGEFDRIATEYLPFGLNFLAEAAKMVGRGYKVRRSKGNAMEEVTKNLGLDVYSPKQKKKVVKK